MTSSSKRINEDPAEDEELLLSPGEKKKINGHHYITMGGGGGGGSSLQLSTHSSSSSSSPSSSQMGNSNNGMAAADRKAFLLKVGSALFYGISSFMITVTNKTVLTYYHFPSFLVLSLGQMLAGIVVLFTCRKLKLVSFQNLTRDTPRKIFPLPLIYLGNMMFGLGGTQALSLPMFAALRRFSILMTMLLELKILGLRPSFPVQISVYSMIGGALIAASDDLSFNVEGYTYVMITNTLTALNGVMVKKKLDSLDMGKFGLMFYNSLFMFLPALVGTWAMGDLHRSFVEFNEWSNPMFVLQFTLSCVMGFVLSYSTILCTQHNSALTTTIVGCLKNICVTYLGMFIGGDYVFSWLNCIGINISVVGSLLYTYVTFRRKRTGGGGGSASGGGGEKLLARSDRKLEAV